MSIDQSDRMMTHAAGDPMRNITDLDALFDCIQRSMINYAMKLKGANSSQFVHDALMHEAERVMRADDAMHFRYELPRHEIQIIRTPFGPSSKRVSLETSPPEENVGMELTEQVRNITLALEWTKAVSIVRPASELWPILHSALSEALIARGCSVYTLTFQNESGPETSGDAIIGSLASNGSERTLHTVEDLKEALRSMDDAVDILIIQNPEALTRPGLRLPADTEYGLRSIWQNLGHIRLLWASPDKATIAALLRDSGRPFYQSDVFISLA
jgi:uncharacterized protein (DUF1778 family)